MPSNHCFDAWIMLRNRQSMNPSGISRLCERGWLYEVVVKYDQYGVNTAYFNTVRGEG